MRVVSPVVVFCCLVTLYSLFPAYAQEEQESAPAEMVTCEQEAEELGIKEPEELAQFLQECEAATIEMGPEEEMSEEPFPASEE